MREQLSRLQGAVVILVPSPWVGPDSEELQRGERVRPAPEPDAGDAHLGPKVPHVLLHPKAVPQNRSAHGVDDPLSHESGKVGGLRGRESRLRPRPKVAREGPHHPQISHTQARP